jgi:oxygen-independent coproporphyrinogen-3 oxidase
VTAAGLRTLAAAGVTRVSLGVQSMVPSVLAALGRTHDPTNVRRAVDCVRAAGIDHLNVDLIYGAAGESLEDWRATVEAAVDLDPDHVSAYALTVEPATPLGRAVAAGERRPPDDDDQATKYEIADDLLHAAGFAWYEVSNWARPGGECRHNRCYWEGGDYVAIGCAAHGKTGDRRWWNVRTPERYVAAVRAGRSPEGGGEEPGPATREFERRSLALRTAGGVAAAGLDPDGLAAVRAAGLVTIDSGRVRLTRAGRLLASEVTVRLLPSAGTDLRISSR